MARTNSTSTQTKLMIESEWLRTIKGKRVTYVWTDFSALFIEFGELRAGKKLSTGANEHPFGEISLFAGYTWRIERARSVVAGSGCKASKRISGAEKLLHCEVEDIQISIRIPELQIKFSNGLWLSTFNPDPGQPDWKINFNTPSIYKLSVANGKLRINPD